MKKLRMAMRKSEAKKYKPEDEDKYKSLLRDAGFYCTLIGFIKAAEVGVTDADGKLFKMDKNTVSEWYSVLNK